MEQKIIVLTDEQLREFSAEIQNKVPPQQAKPEIHDYMGSEEALKFLMSYLGIPLGESWLSKMCMSGKIPYTRFGGRRIFNRTKLTEWCESQLATPPDPVLDAVTGAARKRGRKPGTSR